MTSTLSKKAAIEVDMPDPFHEGWNRIDGVAVEGRSLAIDPAAYFFRYDNPSWVVCDWESVKTELLPAAESQDATIEQIALEHVKEHGKTTDDPTEVLKVAWEVNSWQFRDEHLNDRGLVALGVENEHLRMLRECCTLMALNRVEKDGTISNVGPAWMFPVACKVVYELDDAKAMLLDELYHGTWFDEARRVEAVKANAALGGKLVHGCQSKQDMRGGAIVPFGADLGKFRRELAQFGDDWIERVEAGGR